MWMSRVSKALHGLDDLVVWLLFTGGVGWLADTLRERVGQLEPLPAPHRYE